MESLIKEGIPNNNKNLQFYIKYNANIVYIRKMRMWRMWVILIYDEPFVYLHKEKTLEVLRAIST